MGIRMTRACLAALLLAVATQARAESMHEQDWLVRLDGKAIGTATLRWSDVAGAESYDERLEIGLVQGGRRARIGYRYTFARVHGTQAWQFSRAVEQGQSHQFDRGRIESGELRVDASSLGARHYAVAVPGDAVLPFERIALLQAASRASKAGEDRPWFDLGALSTMPARVSACASHEPGCVRFDFGGAASPGEAWTFDANGMPAHVEREFADLPLELVRCNGACDTKSVVPLDFLARLLVRAPVRIPHEAAQRQLRYLVSRRDGQPPVLIDTGDQRVVAQGDKSVVSVCRNCGSLPAPTARELQDASRATPWLQSGDPLIRRLAVHAGPRSASVDSRMKRSVVLVSRALVAVRSFVGYADAVQVLKMRQADCIGHAVVLAAVARAQGIPARIVVGMAYADRYSGQRDVFSPHAWVQAWDGTRWASYDAALGDFDSTHIAFATIVDDPAQAQQAFAQLSQLRVEKVAAVKPG
jgi:hypothetical protein